MKRNKMSWLGGVLPKARFNRWLIAAFLALWAISCISVPYPKYFAMQHVPTVLATISLTVAERRLIIDRLGFTCVILFLLLHLLGARYLYSFVPYDDWAEQLFGIRITDCFGFQRNHYDRLVHFGFGLLFVYPLWRFFERELDAVGWWPAALAASIVLAASAVYEIGEWLTAMTFAPDWADAYNGQQGDSWDAQRDMAFAAVGSIVGAGLIGVVRRTIARRRYNQLLLSASNG